NFTYPVVETVAAGGLTASMRNFDQRTVLRHTVQNFVQCDDCCRHPRATFLKRHELDEANDDTFFAGEHAEGNDLVFVEAAHQHTIHFERPETGAARGTNSGEHVIVASGDRKSVV